MSRYFCERSNILAVETRPDTNRAPQFYIVLVFFNMRRKTNKFKKNHAKNILLHAFLVKLNNYQIKMRLTTT